jgi:hypothetical protein
MYLLITNDYAGPIVRFYLEQYGYNGKTYLYAYPTDKEDDRFILCSGKEETRKCMNLIHKETKDFFTNHTANVWDKPILINI